MIFISAILPLVSKPDAENPIVKKAKIPKPELKTGTEDYQKNSSSLNLIRKWSSYW